jgi:hypothetical protein
VGIDDRPPRVGDGCLERIQPRRNGPDGRIQESCCGQKIGSDPGAHAVNANRPMKSVHDIKEI